MKVGSLTWFLHHELRLWWRSIITVPRMQLVIIFLGIFFTFIFISLWWLLGDIRDSASFTTIPDVAVWIGVGCWVMGWLYSLSLAMEYSLIALFERGDLDLLVSSPVNSKVIFASRLLSVAIEIFLSFCLVVVPASLLAVSIGIPQLLGIYPTLIALSLLSASFAMLLVLWLVRLFGAKRARSVAQILAAVTTTVFVISFQLPNIINNPTFWENIGKQIQPLFSKGTLFSVDSWIWFPARAIFFEPQSVMLVLLISSGLAWLTVESLHRYFIESTQKSLTQKATTRQNIKEKTLFVGGFNRVVLFKEWLIIWRNPYLISRVFLQVFLIIPAILIIQRGEINPAYNNLTSYATVASSGIGGFLAMTLTQICVSGEEASDLLKSAPAHGETLRRLKLLAALIPVWVLLSPLFLILIYQGRAWFTPLLVFLGSSICAAILRLWNSRPINIGDLFRRSGSKAQADLFLGILEVVSFFSWISVGLSLNSGRLSPILIRLGIIGVVVAISYWRSRQIGTSLGF